MSEQTNPTTTRIGAPNPGRLIWQGWNDDYGQEPALLVTLFKNSGVIEISQENRSVNISYATIPALIKALKELGKLA